MSLDNFYDSEPAEKPTKKPEYPYREPENDTAAERLYGIQDDRSLAVVKKSLTPIFNTYSEKLQDVYDLDDERLRAAENELTMFAHREVSSDPEDMRTVVEKFIHRATKTVTP